MVARRKPNHLCRRRWSVRRHFPQVIDGAAKEEVLFHSDTARTPLDWSSDGRWLLYCRAREGYGFDLWALPDANGPAGLERKPISVPRNSFQRSAGQIFA